MVSARLISMRGVAVAKASLNGALESVSLDAKPGDLSMGRVKFG